jgi:hypothetical protein
MARARLRLIKNLPPFQCWVVGSAVAIDAANDDEAIAQARRASCSSRNKSCIVLEIGGVEKQRLSGIDGRLSLFALFPPPAAFSGPPPGLGVAKPSGTVLVCRALVRTGACFTAVHSRSRPHAVALFGTIRRAAPSPAAGLRLASRTWIAMADGEGWSRRTSPFGGEVTPFRCYAEH